MLNNYHFINLLNYYVMTDFNFIELGNVLSFANMEEDVNEAMATLLACVTKFDIPEQVEAIAKPLITLHMLMEDQKAK